MSALQIERIHPDFGVRITGIDMREPPDEAVMDEIRALAEEYSFLHFPEQDMDDAKQLAFTRGFGEPEPNHVVQGQEGRIVYFGTIGNVMQDGTKLGNDHKRTIFQTGNNLWHSDSSFRKVPCTFSVMCAYEVPAEGGRTEFVSERAAYDRLPDAMKERIDPLFAVHDYVFSRSKVAPDAVTPSHAASLPPVRQKLVRKNPRTGAKNYFVGSHAKEIVGWRFEESRALIDDLQDRAVRDEYVYAHAWQPGDLVVWDNRCLLHRGSGYDADKYRRLMRQTRVAGTASTLDED